MYMYNTYFGATSLSVNLEIGNKINYDVKSSLRTWWPHLLPDKLMANYVLRLSFNQLYQSLQDVIANNRFIDWMNSPTQNTNIPWQINGNETLKHKLNCGHLGFQNGRQRYRFINITNIFGYLNNIGSHTYNMFLCCPEAEKLNVLQNSVQSEITGSCTWWPHISWDMLVLGDI